MSTSASNRKSLHAAAGRFASTQWSLVLAAGRRSTPDAEQALAKLCGAYWPPIYAYLRRRGYLAPEAEDLTQSFFVRLLEKNDLRDASPERGKFRSFLLASLKHFLANEWDRAKARKRGGQFQFISLEEIASQEDRRPPDPQTLTPEEQFERQWALTALNRVIARMETSRYAARRRAIHRRGSSCRSRREPGDWRSTARQNPPASRILGAQLFRS